MLKELLHVIRRKPERQAFFDWYVGEVQYADRKFPADQRSDHDRAIRLDNLSPDSFWFRQIMQYADRVRLFGLDTPQGRQALAKMTMTMIGCVESTIRVYGPLPAPGVPSGEIIGN